MRHDSRTVLGVYRHLKYTAVTMRRSTQTAAPYTSSQTCPSQLLTHIVRPELSGELAGCTFAGAMPSLAPSSSLADLRRGADERLAKLEVEVAPCISRALFAVRLRMLSR
eukprot:7384977-Prymnesium_polylepis.1